jgi:hypothetical protein
MIHHIQKDGILHRASKSKVFKTDSHFINLSNYLYHFPVCNFATFIASLLCLIDLLFKLQDLTFKEMYEPGAVAQDLYTQKKAAEKAVTIHIRAT